MQGRHDMDFGYDTKTQALQERMLDFMDQHVYPAEQVFAEQASEQAADPATRWNSPPIVAALKTQAREAGLWNLFAPPSIAGGAGLTNLQYAPLAEISGRSPFLAPEAINCSAPDTGNMEVLAHFGTPEQQKLWLTPLLAGEIRSGFCMTEPDVASSDATNIRTQITRDGEHLVINGRKWWTTGAMNPHCAVFIVMGKTDPDADTAHQQSMVLVPRGTSGMTIKRGLTLMGYDDSSHGGHAEIEFVDCRVPVTNMIGKAGDGFHIAQSRLGGGRIHHCMRLIGMAERAYDLMVQRAVSRSAFGKPLADQGVVHGWISQSRVRIEMARLLVLRAAWAIDERGGKGAHQEIQQIKIAVPQIAEWVIDKAIQTHGAAGLSQDFILAELWSQARALRIIDGPDEVHEMSLAKKEIRRIRSAT